MQCSFYIMFFFFFGQQFPVSCFLKKILYFKFFCLLTSRYDSCKQLNFWIIILIQLINLKKNFFNRKVQSVRIYCETDIFRFLSCTLLHFILHLLFVLLFFFSFSSFIGITEFSHFFFSSVCFKVMHSVFIHFMSHINFLKLLLKHKKLLIQFR